MTLAEPRSSATSGPAASSPTTNAAAASPPAASSPLPGNPVRTSAATTSELPGPARPSNSPPTADRTDAPRSNAGTDAPRRNAAWIAVAFVLSAYAGKLVANSNCDGSRSRSRDASRAASTAMVVESSSNEATVRVPFPPPWPTKGAICARSSRRYGR